MLTVVILFFCAGAFAAAHHVVISQSQQETEEFVKVSATSNFLLRPYREKIISGLADDGSSTNYYILADIMLGNICKKYKQIHSGDYARFLLASCEIESNLVINPDYYTGLIPKDYPHFGGIDVLQQEELVATIDKDSFVAVIHRLDGTINPQVIVLVDIISRDDMLVLFVKIGLIDVVIWDETNLPPKATKAEGVFFCLIYEKIKWDRLFKIKELSWVG